jgi:hypothetical protein
MIFRIFNQALRPFLIEDHKAAHPAPSLDLFRFPGQNSRQRVIHDQTAIQDDRS